jgi:hypothetical protein
MLNLLIYTGKIKKEKATKQMEKKRSRQLAYQKARSQRRRPVSRSKTLATLNDGSFLQRLGSWKTRVLFQRTA